MRNSIYTTGSELRSLLEDMKPMFPSKTFAGFHSPKSGKYSFADIAVVINMFRLPDLLKVENVMCNSLKSL
jgi:hypothetical protein